MLGEAIDSALSQKADRKFEVVVIDNCQDAAVCAEVDKMIRSYGDDRLVLYRNEENIGMFGNWNRGIELAQGAWLTILNDDDRLADGWLETVMGIRSGNAFVGVDAEVIGDIPRAPMPYGIILVRKAWRKLSKIIRVRRLGKCDYLRGHPFYGSLGVLFEKRSLVDLGGYDEKYWPSSDYVLSYLYFRRSGGFLINRVLAEYRWEDNASRRPDVLAGFLRIGGFVREDLLQKLRFPIVYNLGRWYSINRTKVDLCWFERRFSLGLEFVHNSVDYSNLKGCGGSGALVTKKFFIKALGLVLCLFL